MTDQMDMFEKAMKKASDAAYAEVMAEKGRARNSDPSTSKEAAESVNATRLELRVFNVIAACQLGVTCEDICEMTGLAWNTVSPRLAPLREKGLIRIRLDAEGIEVKRVGRRTKRRQLVWVAE